MVKSKVPMNSCQEKGTLAISWSSHWGQPPQHCHTPPSPPYNWHKGGACWWDTGFLRQLMKACWQLSSAEGNACEPSRLSDAGSWGQRGPASKVYHIHRRQGV